ncbi:MAG: family 1 encapsulin nanocompartment shell protein [Candidatus Rokuibacteriota bacterium]
MDNLHRGSAPLSDRVWKAVDDAVAQAARHVLAARRIATFDGPRGWDHVATRLGSMTPCRAKEGTAVICVPEVVLLAEVRVDFSLPWAAIHVFERGAPALEAGIAEAAAREAALAEDRLALYGEPIGSGFLTAPQSPSIPVQDWGKPGQVLTEMLQAVETLDALGIAGPYEAVLPPAAYFAYLQAVTDGGYPTARQLKNVVTDIHRSPVVREAGALFSTRGGDFVLTLGGDLTVGYHSHDREAVHLFCVETLAAQTVTPEAVCLLRR